MSINPYQAPAAEGADPPLDGDDRGYTGQIARLPWGAGVTWIADGWDLFRGNPGTWIALALVFALMAIGASLVPLLGALAMNLLFPVFFGGLMFAADAARRGEPPTLGQLFEGFNRQTAQLALVGVLYLAGFLVLVIVAALGFAIAFPLLGANFYALGDINEPAMALWALLFALIVLALTLPLLMAVWFAPALVILHDVPALAAMQQSFKGCLANLGPFLVYGVVTALLALLATLPLMLGWLVLGPILIGSVYASYRQIYCSG